MEYHAVIIWTKEPVQYVVDHSADAEVLDVTVPHYGISDARSLKNHAYQTATQQGMTRQFIIRTESITAEAQQALLKLLEEPPRGVQILFIVRTGVSILPTVLSRCHIVRDVRTPIFDEFTEFLQLSYRERLALIETHHRTKNTEWFTALQAGLGRWPTEGGSALSSQTKNSIQVAYILLGTRGASNKLLSEHIALCLPST